MNEETSSVVNEGFRANKSEHYIVQGILAAALYTYEHLSGKCFYRLVRWWECVGGTHLGVTIPAGGGYAGGGVLAGR